MPRHLTKIEDKKREEPQAADVPAAPQGAQPNVQIVEQEINLTLLNKKLNYVTNLLEAVLSKLEEKDQ